MGQNVGYIFVGSGGEFFWGSVLVLSGMYLLWFALYGREKVLMADITLTGEVWLCGDHVESFGWPNGSELTGSNCGPDIDRTRKDKGAWISSYALSRFGGPYVTWTHDQSIMSPTRFIFMSMQCLVISSKFKYLSVCLCCVTLHWFSCHFSLVWPMTWPSFA